jgi:hypothetical protein
MTVGTSGRFGRGATSLQDLIDVLQELAREYRIEELFLIEEQQNLAAFLKCWCHPNIPLTLVRAMHFSLRGSTIKRRMFCNGHMSQMFCNKRFLPQATLSRTLVDGHVLGIGVWLQLPAALLILCVLCRHDHSPHVSR